MTTFQAIAERKHKNGVLELLRVEDVSGFRVWERAEKLRLAGWVIVETPERVEWPETFPLENAA